VGCLCPDLVTGMGLCGVHRGRVLATDPGLARLDQQSHRPGPDTTTDGDLATRPRGHPGHRRRPDPPLRRRVPRRIRAIVATLLGMCSCVEDVGRGAPAEYVFRGLLLRRWATSCSAMAEWMRRSVPLGKYWRSSPLVFSLLPRCHDLPAWAKNTPRRRDHRSDHGRPSRCPGPTSG
jgi:hypothetical protein